MILTFKSVDDILLSPFKENQNFCLVLLILLLFIYLFIYFAGTGGFFFFGNL